MGINFQWEEKYSVGNDAIDQQHRGIFNLANNLPEKLSPKEMHHTVMKLFKYTRQHFSDEEHLMRELGYPDLESHIKLHDELITELGNTPHSSFPNDEAALAFKKFVYDWIIDHIMRHDKKFFHFAKKQKNDQPD